MICELTSSAGVIFINFHGFCIILVRSQRFRSNFRDARIFDLLENTTTSYVRNRKDSKIKWRKILKHWHDFHYFFYLRTKLSSTPGVWVSLCVFLISILFANVPLSRADDVVWSLIIFDVSRHSVRHTLFEFTTFFNNIPWLRCTYRQNKSGVTKNWLIPVQIPILFLC